MEEGILESKAGLGTGYYIIVRAKASYHVPIVWAPF